MIATPATTTAAPAMQTIVEIAAGNPDFSILVEAVKAAGLVDTLSGPGPYTVFAPTNAAFAALPAGTLDDLLKPENKDKLVAVLTYHVVPGSLKAGDVVAAKELKTVNGKAAKISTANGAKIDNAGIVATDIECANGIIHVIDSVILP